MRRRRLVACMTQVHWARDRDSARSGGRTVGGSRIIFARYVPFRFYADSRVILQRACKRGLAW
jgi:hypothetical protein